MEPAARHRCMIYEGSPAKHLPWVIANINHQLQSNRRCIYLNTPRMVADLAAGLAADGIDALGEIRRGRLVLSSDQTHLRDGRFDTPRMIHALTGLVSSAETDGYSGIWIAGDMTWEFGDQSNLQELLAYERALEEAFHRLPILSGCCLYHRDTLPIKALRDALCSHQSVYLNETLFRVNPYFNLADTPPSLDPFTEVNDLVLRFQQHSA